MQYDHSYWTNMEECISTRTQSVFGQSTAFCKVMSWFCKRKTWAWHRWSIVRSPEHLIFSSGRSGRGHSKLGRSLSWSSWYVCHANMLRKNHSCLIQSTCRIPAFASMYSKLSHLQRGHARCIWEDLCVHCIYCRGRHSSEWISGP